MKKNEFMYGLLLTGFIHVISISCLERQELSPLGFYLGVGFILAISFLMRIFLACCEMNNEEDNPPTDWASMVYYILGGAVSSVGALSWFLL